MRRLIGRGVLLTVVLGVAFSCSSTGRNFGTGTAGSAGDAGHAGTPPISGGGSGGSVATGAAGARDSVAGMAEGGAATTTDGGAAGLTDVGAAGAPGPLGDCQPNQTRLCGEDGALGPCAAGTETCTADLTWGPCNVKPAGADTCQLGDDANCNGIANEGCPCVAGMMRACSAAGAMGSCAAGKQACTSSGLWGGCSIQPASKDTCTSGNDDNCNGTPNEGCICIQGTTRTCAAAGLVGKCASGNETCGADGTWGACSIVPSAADTCAAGNNDNCSGPANEGCQCINGVTTRPCGACNDGTQVCSDGKTNTYGACTGAVKLPSTYYLDADGDGFGSATTTTVCGPAPAGYVTKTGDCCDDGGNLALAKTIFPGQTQYFAVPASICGISWNYDCSPGDSIEISPPSYGSACTATSAAPNCVTVMTPLTASSCGTLVGGCSCGLSGQVGGNGCGYFCGGSFTAMCH